MLTMHHHKQVVKNLKAMLPIKNVHSKLAINVVVVVLIVLEHFIIIVTMLVIVRIKTNMKVVKKNLDKLVDNTIVNHVRSYQVLNPLKNVVVKDHITGVIQQKILKKLLLPTNKLKQQANKPHPFRKIGHNKSTKPKNK